MLIVSKQYGHSFVVGVAASSAAASALLSAFNLFIPFTSKNTAKATIDALDMSKHTGAFVNIVNTKNEVVFDLPVSTMYMDKIRTELEKRSGNHLSSTEKKNLLLEITRENRSYDLKSTLGEEEWNY